MKLAREYVMAILSFIVTLVLTLIAEFLGLGREISYLTFATGTVVTLTAALLEKQLETKLEDEMRQAYRLTMGIDDAELKSEVFKLARNLSRGEIPPYIAAIRSTRLFERTKKSVHAADYNPFLQDILHWEGSRLATWYRSGIDAVKRGVSLERIFILKKENVLKDGKWDKDTLRILQKQSKDGIAVRILWIEEATTGDVHPQRNVLQNVVIFDETEVLVTTQEPLIFRLPSERVREFIEIFEEQKKFSRTLDEVLSEVPIT